MTVTSSLLFAKIGRLIVVDGATHSTDIFLRGMEHVFILVYLLNYYPNHAHDAFPSLRMWLPQNEVFLHLFENMIQGLHACFVWKYAFDLDNCIKRCFPTSRMEKLAKCSTQHRIIKRSPITTNIYVLQSKTSF